MRKRLRKKKTGWAAEKLTAMYIERIKKQAERTCEVIKLAYDYDKPIRIVHDK